MMAVEVTKLVPGQLLVVVGDAEFPPRGGHND